MGDSVNYVKTSNKLIGDIINNDLYDSDEANSMGGPNRDQFLDQEDFRNEELDFGPSKKEGEQDGKVNQKFLQILKNKRDQQE